MDELRTRVLARTNYLFALILVIFVSGIVVAQTRQRAIRAGRDLTGTVAGLKIVQVAPDGAAARAGLKYGDVLIGYNSQLTTTEQELDEAIRLQSNPAHQSAAAELSMYLDGNMTVKSVRVSVGRLGIFTREWTLAGALVEDAILNRSDSVLAQKYADEAAASKRYTRDQILRMRLMCLTMKRTEAKFFRLKLMSSIGSIYPRN